MSETLGSCPLCGSHKIHKGYKKISDHAVSQETFTLDRCQDCDLIFTNPRPSQQEIHPYYDFEEYYSHSDGGKDLISKIYQTVKDRNINTKLKRLEKLIGRKGKWLDYGCGTAELINQGNIHGWTVFGIEPNQQAFSLSQIKLPNQIFQSIDSCDENSFDIITLYHVLEHIHDLKETVDQLLKRLKVGGYIIIAVPNPLSLDSEKYGPFWAGWDVPRHLYHFTDHTMQKFAQIYNLNLIETEPLVFDSYYVSLLSEKYKNPNTSNIVKYSLAFLSGIQSNTKARINSNRQHSSNIYYFQKS
ncbi:class I SAM-dependent methyltransferase [Algoriphagus sediminis]|uniref:Class I SAM-dependent methyltransferase n=1 Tax=Algoriphagus sediminis TaxID=3057113 RepID=A0ABT7YC34_9BACT|nr:class I SAM-dependent methyltransferase [Algoriphagus sediminis]MDN3203955.1 class I SAM-dependent methyltransferase [Algoriphagus sediminis]